MSKFLFIFISLTSSFILIGLYIGITYKITQYSASDIGSFNTHQGKIYFKIKSKNFFYPVLVSVKKTDEESAVVNIMKQSNYSLIKGPLWTPAMNNDFISVLPQYNSKTDTYSISLIDSFKGLKVKLE